jgi:aspartate racemase
MKTLGIVGGIAPESTIEYYRSIITLYRSRRTDGSYPPVIINSIDMQKMLGMIGAGELAEVTEYLLNEVRKLANAGADFGLFASNTPHIVFEAIRRESPIPLLSIVESACRAATALGMKKVGLIGTRFTMQGTFYAEVFSRHAIGLVVPDAPDQEYVHGKYMGELISGVYLPETRDGLLAAVERLKQSEEIDGLILGGTELPLILRGAAVTGVPFLDTTRIHAEEAVERMLGSTPLPQ